jgi:hypothetical protein
MELVRKTVCFVENILVEGGRAGGPLKLVAVAAVIRNPWAGSFVEDLRPAILATAPPLAKLLVPMLIEASGGQDKIEAYGKAAVVGTLGEIEHGSGLIHTLRFGNIFRDGVGGKTFLPFTNTRGGPGVQIQIPVSDKFDEGRRSHYLTISFCVSDAPAPDEIVVAIGGSTGGRLHPRIGDRYRDMEEMGIEHR